MEIKGKKGGGGKYTQRPDNLRSDDTFEGLLGLGTGPWKGPTKGLQSIRIDGTPIEDASGKSNFPGWVTLFANGDPVSFPQKPDLKLGAGTSPVAINLALSNTSGTGTPIVKSVPNTNANFIDLRFVINQLYKQNKKGVFEETLKIQILMKPTGTTTWINPLVDSAADESVYVQDGINYDGSANMRVFVPREDYSETYDATLGGYPRIYPGQTSGALTVRGKTTQPYVREIRIEVPNTGVYAGKGWDIECTLLDKESVDADPLFEKRQVTWESAAAVYKDDNLGAAQAWRGLVWLSAYGAASDKLTGVPEVWGEYDTKIQSVPPSSVYNPDTRQYTGTTWDGSWSKAFTNDPAWVINGVLSDGIEGLSAIAPGTHLNKWDALDLSKYCSQLVDDGKGGTHPRFSLNYWLDQPQKADEFVRNLAGAVSAIAWDNGNGEWRAKVDRIETPSAIFTEENIGGEFNYSHTDVDARFNDITMVFLNAEFDYREDRVRVYDQADIDAHGRKPTTLVAMGCTNRQEALRRAMLRLRTSINEYRTVTFTTNRQGRLVQPLDTILIADKSLGYLAPTGSTALADSDTTDNRTTGRMIGRRANHIRNSAMAGAAAGVAPAQGTLPTNWAVDLPAGLAWSVPATGNTDGEFVDIKIAGTASAAGDIVIRFDSDTQIVAQTGQDWAASLEAKLQAGTSPATHSLHLQERDAAGAFLVATSSTFTPSASWQSPSALRAFTNAGAKRASAVITAPIALNAAVDYTLRLRKPQLEDSKAVSAWIRTTSIAVCEVSLRDSLRLEPGASYKVHLTVPNPDYTPAPTSQPASADWAKPTITITRNVTSDSTRGDVKTLLVETALPANTPTNAPLALDAPGLPSLPRTYRVVEVGESDDGERVSINAIEVDTGKYAAADTVSEGAINSQIPNAAVPIPLAPAAGIFHIKTFTANTQVKRVLEIDWERPSSKYITGYEVWYRFNNGPKTFINATTDTRVELQNPEHGFYRVEIIALDRRGNKSEPLVAEYEVLEESLYAPVGYLTNESHTVATLTDGTGGSYGSAGGEFILQNALGIIPDAEITYSVVGAPAWLTIGTNGVYTVSDPGVDSASATLRALWGTYTVEKQYTISKSKQGTAGATAKMLLLISTTQTVPTETNGSAVTGTAVITFTAQKQNTTAAVTFSMTKLDGTAVDGAIALSGTGDERTLTHADFTTARGTGEGVIVTATCDGLTDKISVVRVQKGVKGDTGAAAVVGYLTNESHTLSATNEGIVSTYTGANGDFKIYAGSTDVSTNFALSTPTGGNPQALTVTYTGQSYSVTGGFDASEDAATLDILATGSGSYAGVTITKRFTLSKSKTGDKAKGFIAISDGQLVKYDTDGNLIAGQTITVTGQKQNTSANLIARLFRLNADGTQIQIDAGTYLTGSGTVTADSPDVNSFTQTGNLVTLSGANFHTAIQNGVDLGLIVELECDSIKDKISIIRVRDGSKGDTGAQGPTITLTADKAGFTYTDGVLDPATQTITFTAAKDAAATNAVWSTSPNIKSATTGSTFTINNTEMGANTQVIVTADVGGIKQSKTLTKLADPVATKTPPTLEQATPPANPVKGTVWIDTSTRYKRTYNWDGTRWVLVGGETNNPIHVIRDTGIVDFETRQHNGFVENTQIQ